MTSLHSQRGFVLVATLWLLAIMTIGAAFFAEWTEKAVRLAGDLQASIQADIDMRSTEATVLYLLGTQRMTLAGLTLPDPITQAESGALGVWGSSQVPANNTMDMGINLSPIGREIALDGQAYYGIGKAEFSLQDESGLISLSMHRATLLQGLLSYFDVPVEEHPALLAKFEDYIDMDNLHRINGAEEAEYLEQGYDFGPTNRLLRSVNEMQSVLGWDKLNQIWASQQWSHLTTVATVTGLPNMNFAPLPVLRSVPGFNLVAAERIISTRRITPFLSSQQVYDASGVRLLNNDEMAMRLTPSEYLRLTLWYTGAKRSRQIHLTLTATTNDGKPWIIRYDMEQSFSHTEKQNTPDQPTAQSKTQYAKTRFFPTALSAITP